MSGYMRGGVLMNYYKAPATYNTTVAPQSRPAPTVTDDYERWYTEAMPNNRMLLALKCGIDQEIGWALDRLCRLCNNEQFMLKVIPGLTDALFEWPEWYLTVASRTPYSNVSLFALERNHERRRRHALESVFILRNSAINEPNARELAAHPKTIDFIMRALYILESDSDSNEEFLQYCIELLHAVNPTFLPLHSSSPTFVNPISRIESICTTSSNRSLIIACLTTLTSLISGHHSSVHPTATSICLNTSIRYLPLFSDKVLVSVCLNYMYAHLSHPGMTKAFLLHPEMPVTLRLLVSLLLNEQVEETVTIDISQPLYTAPFTKSSVVNYEITGEELEELVSKPEPERCYEWMRRMFIQKSDAEMTQVDFWNLYKDIFTPYQDRYPLLVASDVIKNVNVVFSSAQAMVLPGPPQRFVVKGVDRQKKNIAPERFKCYWERSICSSAAFSTPDELYTHLLDHLKPVDLTNISCLWSNCFYSAASLGMLRSHISTHLSSEADPVRASGQVDKVTLSTQDYPHPVVDATKRPPPPRPNVAIKYLAPTADPPSNSLTALLIIRLLFRTSFASTDAAPRADADHFGFPGTSEDQDGEEEEEEDTTTVVIGDNEREGERRGRKAFANVRSLMEEVRIRDSSLMAWITEMVDAGLTGVH